MMKFLLLPWDVFRLSKMVFFMTFACLSLSAQARVSKIRKSFDINVQNATVKEVFSLLTRNAGVFFTYSNDEFDDSRKISISAHNVSFKEVLDQVLVSSNFKWEFKGGFIVLKKDEKNQDVFKVRAHELTDSLIIVSGIVKSEKGMPIPGVTVVVDGTKIGTATDVDGNFSLKNVPVKSIITIKSIGYVAQQFRVITGKEWQSITLKESINTLDAAIVEAYSVTSKRYSTSGISTISAKDIEKKPVTNVLLAMQGEVPGIVIQQASGASNSGVSVQIRGLNSLTKGVDPLYVIDGVPYTSQLMETIIINSLGYSGESSRGFAKQGNPLSFINPNDIESISVLKDADATAIYGSRAAAGAILITTKKGKAGSTQFNVNYQNGWGKVSKFMNLLNREQYLEMRHEAKRNSNQAILPADYDLNGTWDTTRSTDWQKELLGGTANFSDLQVTTSGGTENTRFLIGAGYHRESSVFLANTLNKKGSLHFNINNLSPNGKFNVQLSGSYLADENQPPISTLTSTALTLAPVAPALFNKDGSLNWAPDKDGRSTWTNPMAAGLVKTRVNTNNLVSNLQLSYELLTGLKIKSSLGYTNMQINEISAVPFTSFSPEDQAANVQRRTSFSNGSIKSWIIEPQITYEIDLGRNRLEALIGGTLQNQNNRQQAFRSYGFNSDQLLEDPNSSTSTQILYTVGAPYRYNAIFARFNYRLLNRYIFNLSARRDGSSRFGSENHFHNFGSIGAAWIFSEESFVSKTLPFVTFGKMQASYGITGNDQIGDYNYLNVFYSNSSPVPYQGKSSLTSNGLPNPHLQWEETKKMQLGLDFGFLDNTILFNATYFCNRSSNQLLGYTLPNLTGFGGYTRNFPATFQNSGWEFSSNVGLIKKKNFNWNSKINFYIPKNKLVSFPNIENSSYATIYTIGHPITNKRLYDFAGVNSETGLYQFRDYKGNIIANPNYMTDYIKEINTAPAYTGGITNTFSFKGFQLDILLQYSKQWVRSLKFGNALPGQMINQPSTILDRWKKSGDDASIQKVTSNNDIQVLIQYYTANLISSGQYMNCGYLKLRNVSLSWNVPGNWCSKGKLRSAQIYLHAQNLFTFSNFIGPDPETGISASLAPLRTITCGLQVGL